MLAALMGYPPWPLGYGCPAQKGLPLWGDKGLIKLGNGFKNKPTTQVDRPPGALGFGSGVVSQMDS